MSKCPPVVLDTAIIDGYGLHPLAGWLYVVIARHVNCDTGEGFPSVVQLAKLANMSRASVLRYTKDLEAANLIQVDRRKGRNRNENNIYKLLTATSEVSDSNQRSVTETPEEPALVVSDVDHKQELSDLNKQTVKNTKKTPAPKNGADTAEPKVAAKPRPRNPMYDAIEKIWRYTASMNTLMAKMLTGTATKAGWKEYNLETPVTPVELLEWASWYRKHELKGDTRLNMLEDRAKIQSSITYWQKRRAAKQEQQQQRDEADRLWQRQHPELYARAGGASW